jgi:DNA-directed RNA polymerase specialized sigma24 family protein
MTPDERERLARAYLGWARWVAFRDLTHTYRGRIMVNRDPCVIDDTVDLAMVRTLDKWHPGGVPFASYLAHQIRFQVCNRLRPPTGLGHLQRRSMDYGTINPVTFKWAEWHGLGIEPEWLLTADTGPVVVDAADTLDVLLADATPRTATVFRLLADGASHAEIEAGAGLRRKQVQNTIYSARPTLQTRWGEIAS